LYLPLYVVAGLTPNLKLYVEVGLTPYQKLFVVVGLYPYLNISKASCGSRTYPYLEVHVVVGLTPYLELYVVVGLTPYLELYVVVGLAEWVGCLALVSAAVRLLGRRDQELGAHMLQLTDHRDRSPA
jgi:hypothetical protein